MRRKKDLFAEYEDAAVLNTCLVYSGSSSLQSNDGLERPK